LPSQTQKADKGFRTAMILPEIRACIYSFFCYSSSNFKRGALKNKILDYLNPESIQKARLKLMALINVKKNEIQLKIVYYGPGRGGKTSSLEYIQSKLAHSNKVKMIKLTGNRDRTLFFDFYPLNLGRIKGLDVRIQLYSVPGQDRLEPLRKLILRGVDGIVFVADSMILRRNNNIQSFENLIKTLRLYNKKISTIPLVFQFNKVDLAQEGIPILHPDDIKDDLRNCLGDNRHIVDASPCYESSIVTGQNILRSLQDIIKLTLKHLHFDALARAN
jgi:GTPase SAR1 family protein